jgi:hypothetical protein
MGLLFSVAWRHVARAQDRKFAWEESACFQITKGANRLAWIEGREKASMAKLEGSIDGDVCTSKWSNLVGHSCRRLRCKTYGVV